MLFDKINTILRDRYMIHKVDEGIVHKDWVWNTLCNALENERNQSILIPLLHIGVNLLFLSAFLLRRLEPRLDETYLLIDRFVNNGDDFNHEFVYPSPILVRENVIFYHI